MDVTAGTLFASPIPVRGDVDRTLRDALDRLSKPGPAWTSPQRIAMAAEVRAARKCELCAERKAAVTPAAVKRSHNATPELPAVIVDALHRIATDPGRLTRSWFDGVLESGISDVAFAEAVGVMATVVALDTFALGIASDAPAMKPPAAGEPSGARPTGAEVHSAWIPTVRPELSVGGLAEYYERWTGAALGVAHIGRAISLSPADQIGFFEIGDALYVPVEKLVDFTWGRAIDRSQIELLAATVSATNECFY
jgi:hypothetical protein